MSTTPTIEELQASVTKLQGTLTKVREEHKAEKAAILAPVRKALALGDDAGPDAILAALTTRTPDAEAIIAERTKGLTAERDAAVAAAEQVKTERAAERVGAAITAALGKSGMIPANYEDAATMLRGVLEVGKDGAIVTKTAPNVIAGQTAEQYIHAQLKAARAHWWGVSVGGSAAGSTGHGARLADDSCFDPRSAKFSVTAQALWERTNGSEAARRAAARYGQRLAGEGRR